MATQPPDFIPDDEAPDFILDEGTPSGFAAAGAANPRAASEQLLTGALKGGGRAALSLVNPVDWVRAAKAAAALGYKLMKPPVLGQPYEGAQALEDIAQGAKNTAQYAATSPEALGEVTGSTAVALAGPKILGKADIPIASIARRSRATNIVRAISGPAEAVPDVVAAGDRAELPVSLTQGSLARKLAGREAAADAAVGATRADLPGDVPFEAVASRLPEVGVDVGGVTATGDRGLLRATERGRAYWENLATDPALSGTIPRKDLALVKSEAQDAAARGGAYRKSNLDLPIAAGADASMAEGAAIRRAVLDRTGLSPEEIAKVDAYEQALGEASLSKTLSGPAQAEHLRRVTGKGGGDWKASLVGRVVAPGLVGGTVGALGGVAMSPAGALAGMGVAEFMKSTMWNTFSAATKLKATRALEAGDVASFRNIVLRAAIADVERRRLAEQALKAQGEGVTAP